MSSGYSLINKGEFIIGNDLKEFIAEIANSSIKSEILEFMYYNPTNVFNPSLIAQAIGRKEEQVREALSDFVEADLLRQIRDVPAVSYTAVANDRLQDLLDRFVRLFNSSNGRELVRSIIDDMSAGSRYYRREYICAGKKS